MAQTPPPTGKPDSTDGRALPASQFYMGVQPEQTSAEDPLGHIQLFARLSAGERAELLSTMTRQHVANNQTIFWLGDKGESFFMVQSGMVAITVPNEQGEHVTINTLGPGGFFGEISLLDGGPRTATVRAIEGSELLVLSREAFHSFIRRRPDVAIEVLTVMGHRQRASTEALRQMKNPNEVFESGRMNLWQRVSDVIATTAASQWFTLFHLCWFGGWIGLNVVGLLMERPPKFMSFDPFPFGLLTMVVSLEAIFLSIFVMVSQNRQSEKDRLRTDLDYQVNVKAQTEIMNIARRLETLERIEEQMGKLNDRVRAQP
ncbi:MAG: DUF1003 domain-containing protein [Phycisphaerales bacterium]